MRIEVRVVDVAATARAAFGEEGASYIAGRPLPSTDYRFEAVTPTGGQITFHRGATAEDVALYWQREGWIEEGQEEMGVWGGENAVRNAERGGAEQRRREESRARLDDANTAVQGSRVTLAELRRQRKG